MLVGLARFSLRISLVLLSIGLGTDAGLEKSMRILSSRFLVCLGQTILLQMKHRWMFPPLFLTFTKNRGEIF